AAIFTKFACSYIAIDGISKRPEVWFGHIFALQPALGLLNLRRIGFRKKDLVRPAHQVRALFFEQRTSLAHLIPGASERVIGEKLHHVARRIELVAEGQFVGIAWGLAFFACL